MNNIQRFYAGDLRANDYVAKAADVDRMICDFGRVTAERDALQERLNAADQKDDDLSFQLHDREGSRRDWFEEAQRLQAELAERDALLHRIYEASEWTRDAAHYQEEVQKLAYTALSASAEPSEREAHALQAEKALGIERLPAKPSAPVERDERADFLAWACREYEVGAEEELNERNVVVIQNWAGWKARAALERKP